MQRGIIADAMASKLLAEASRTGLALAAGVRHLAWYLSYHLDLGGSARVEDARERRRRARRASRGR